MSFSPTGIDPMPGIPMVRVLDESGNEVMRGWYMRHENRQPCVLDDELREEDVDHLVMRDEYADWNMPRNVAVTRVTPPHIIEVIEEER